MGYGSQSGEAYKKVRRKTTLDVLKCTFVTDGGGRISCSQCKHKVGSEIIDGKLITLCAYDR
jgi:hypothetical protein